MVFCCGLDQCNPLYTLMESFVFIEQIPIDKSVGHLGLKNSPLHGDN